MRNNAQKQSLAHNLHRFGDNKVQDWDQLYQQRIPCHVVAVGPGQLVTVAFDLAWMPFTLPQVQMPKAQSAYNHEPTQPGDKGYAVASDFYLGGQSGLGGGTADQYRRGNLSNLTFQPVSNKVDSSANPNLNVLQGPAGVILQDDHGDVVVTVSTTQITINPKAGTIVYLGGDGVTGSYAPISTASGPSLNVKARWA